MKTLLIIAFILNPIISPACSMYKITSKDKTVVGNNEDWLSPNSQFWFETGNKNKFGVMYMGLLNNFAQGAINEAGLVFDGFANPELSINNTKGKTVIPIGDAITNIMQTMASVEDVKSYLEKINLSSLTSSMLVFVDKTGSYLIVEGDELILGEDDEKAFSNFYYSQVSSADEVKLDNFQRGWNFVKSTQGDSSLEYCGKAMKNFAGFKLFSTQYSTIYDLDSLKIRVYLFHDYSRFVEIDLIKELAKGNYKTMIADLFPKESIGYQHYQKYNDIKNPIRFLKETIDSTTVSETELISMGINNVVNMIGYEWINSKNNISAGIQVLKYGVELMPNDANLRDSLGEAYFLNKEWDNSIKNYTHSIALDANNNKAAEMILKATKNREEAEIED